MSCFKLKKVLDRNIMLVLPSMVLNQIQIMTDDAVLLSLVPHIAPALC